MFVVDRCAKQRWGPSVFKVLLDFADKCAQQHRGPRVFMFLLSLMLLADVQSRKVLSLMLLSAKQLRDLVFSRFCV